MHVTVKCKILPVDEGRTDEGRIRSVGNPRWMMDGRTIQMDPIIHTCRLDTRIVRIPSPSSTYKLSYPVPVPIPHAYYRNVKEPQSPLLLTSPLVFSTLYW